MTESVSRESQCSFPSLRTPAHPYTVDRRTQDAEELENKNQFPLTTLPFNIVRVVRGGHDRGYHAVDSNRCSIYVKDVDRRWQTL